MAAPRAVILDVDGTLIESNDAHAGAYVDAARELGYDADFDQVRRLIGMGGDKLVPRVFGFDKESPEGERISERKKEIFEAKYLPKLRATPGARSLLRRFRDDGMKRVVATSAGGDEMEALLKQAGIGDLVQDATSASDVEDSKPDPDVVLAALKKAGVPAAQTVMLGDTPYDVEAAGKAGVRLVALRCGGWRDEELRGAETIYDDPADVLRHYDDSPFGSAR